MGSIHDEKETFRTPIETPPKVTPQKSHIELKTEARNAALINILNAINFVTKDISQGGLNQANTESLGHLAKLWEALS